MATAQEVLKIAAGEIGYSRWNDPLTGTKYGRWYAGITNSSYFGTNGVPYCAMFVSWVFNQAGQSHPGLPTAACATIRNANRNTQYHVKTKQNAKAGDIVLFDWDGDGAPDHVGIVEVNKGSYLQTIEGNTSTGSSGSQSNGGVVARRTRSWGTVYMIIRPDYSAKRHMSEAGIGNIPNQAYTGKPITPKLSSSAGATFNTTYANNTNIGYATATATGIGNWTGSVTKTFSILPKSLLNFTDIAADAWYVSALGEAVDMGLINGYSDTKLGPNDTLTRGQACCLFANAEDVDLDSAFSDVVASPYYYEAVQWAEETGIVNGDGGAFRPDDPCSRQEFACMIHNLYGNPENVGNPSGYKDWTSVADWAKRAVAWCIETGIISGNAGYIRPADPCTRAEAVAMILNMKKVK